MSVTDYTAAQYLAAISAALRADDMEAAAALVRCLAVVDPASASLIYETVLLLEGADDDSERAAVDTGGIDGGYLLALAIVVVVALVYLAVAVQAVR